MGKYEIRVDSSVVKSGRATAAWTTHLGGTVIASGILYSKHNGPNKAVYDGIIAALNQLTDHFSPKGTDEVKIYTDCEPVLKQLNGKNVAQRMEKHLAKVDSFCKSKPNVKFEFIYQNETDQLFKKVDELSKVGRDWMRKILRI